MNLVISFFCFVNFLIVINRWWFVGRGRGGWDEVGACGVNQFSLLYKREEQFLRLVMMYCK